MSSTALEMTQVSLIRNSETILRTIDWTVHAGERWVILGANGCGKTSLIRIAALYDHPSSGKIDVLGETLGRCDVRELRRRIGFVSSAFVDLVRPELLAVDVVMTALNAALEPWWHTYSDEDRDGARAALDSLGLGPLANRRFGTLSSGERQRVQLARAVMMSPELLLFDEPTAGLDMLGRENFVGDLDRIDNTMVLVTHHLEEIPSSFTHAMLLHGGTVLARGAIEDVLTDDRLSTAMGVQVEISRHDRRWAARPVASTKRGRDFSISSRSTRSSTGIHSDPP